MQIKFEWLSSFMGVVEYRIYDSTGTYRAEIRHSYSDYERSIANGADVIRDSESAIGILRRCHGVGPDYSYEIPAETLAAFNEWRAAEHARHIAALESQPERYGIIAPNDPLRNPPMVAKRGRYIAGTGWLALAD